MSNFNNIMDLLFDRIDRSALQPFEEQLVCFTGKVQKVVAPNKNQTFVCIQNITLAPVNNDLPFDQRPQLHFGHMWLDVTTVTHIKHKMYEEIIGCGTVQVYKRKDGSKAYGLVFKEKGFTETGYRNEVVNLLDIINRSDLNFVERAEKVKAVIKLFKGFILDKKIILFESTTQEELKLLDEMQGMFMIAAGCPITLNREGKRSVRKARHRKPALVAKRGFA